MVYHPLGLKHHPEAMHHIASFTFVWVETQILDADDEESAIPTRSIQRARSISCFNHARSHPTAK